MNEDDHQDCPEPTPVETLLVGPDEKGKRLDMYVAKRADGRSRATVQRCIKTGRILLNGQRCRAADRLKPDDRLTLEWPEEIKNTIEGEDIPLNILFEDDDIMVLNKQPDLVIHPNDNSREGTLVNALLHHDQETFKRLTDQYLRPGIVHRLDKDTSGALVIAKNLTARHRLKEAFKQRDVEKTYLAIVIGEFGRVTGRIENRIGRHPVQRTKMAVVEEGGKLAVTNYRVLGGNGELSLLQVRIETGRTHQIRVHFAHLNHPIAGDKVYGGCRRGLAGEAPRQMLHAWKLVFPHPTTGVKREYMAPPPEDFRNLLAAANLPMIAGEETLQPSARSLCEAGWFEPPSNGETDAE